MPFQCNNVWVIPPSSVRLYNYMFSTTFIRA